MPKKSAGPRQRADADPATPATPAPATDGGSVLLPILADLGFAAWLFSLSVTVFAEHPFMTALYSALGLGLLASALALRARTPAALLFAWIFHAGFFALLLLVMVLNLVMFFLSDFTGNRVTLIAGLLILGIVAWLNHRTTQLLRAAREAAAAKSPPDDTNRHD